MDETMLNRLEQAVGKLIDRVGELRDENRRLSDDRRRLETEVQRLQEEIAARSQSEDALLQLRKENEVYKRKTRVVRDQVERMLSRFETLGE
jgi:hypothetical protein